MRGVNARELHAKDRLTLSMRTQIMEINGDSKEWIDAYEKWFRSEFRLELPQGIGSALVASLTRMGWRI